MAIATEAIKQIEANPTLMARVLSAISAGGVSAMDAFLNHPAASFVIGALADWQETGKPQLLAALIQLMPRNYNLFSVNY